MSERDRRRWEERHAAAGGEPTESDPLLDEALAHAPPDGRALDLACGRGRHAVALARRGYDVEAVDISPTALAAARERAAGLGIVWRAADLDQEELERDAYAVVLCVDFTAEHLVRPMIDALRPGGVLVYASRPRDQCSWAPPPGRVAEWFAPLETLVHREDDARIEYVGRRR